MGGIPFESIRFIQVITYVLVILFSRLKMLILLEIHDRNYRSLTVFGNSALGYYKHSIDSSARRVGLRFQVLECSPYDLEQLTYLLGTPISYED